MVAASDLRSDDPCGRTGSSPVPGTLYFKIMDKILEGRIALLEVGDKIYCTIKGKGVDQLNRTYDEDVIEIGDNYVITYSKIFDTYYVIPKGLINQNVEGILMYTYIRTAVKSYDELEYRIREELFKNIKKI